MKYKCYYCDELRWKEESIWFVVVNAQMHYTCFDCYHGVREDEI